MNNSSSVSNPLLQIATHTHANRSVQNFCQQPTSNTFWSFSRHSRVVHSIWNTIFFQQISVKVKSPKKSFTEVTQHNFRRMNKVWPERITTYSTQNCQSLYCTSGMVPPTTSWSTVSEPATVVLVVEPLISPVSSGTGQPSVGLKTT